MLLDLAFIWRGSNHFTLNQGPFKSTPMMQVGVREVFNYTNAGWITMGCGGSQGYYIYTIYPSQ